MEPALILRIVVGALAYFLIVFLALRWITGLVGVYVRYLVVALTTGLFLFGVERLNLPGDNALGVTKAVIAMAAAGCIFYEQHREGQKRPISERWKRFVGVTLGLCAILAYFHAFRFGYYKYYHRHDQYHYYLGAKYFPEIGYDDLYKCTVVAQDQLGTIQWRDDAGRMQHLDVAKEVRRPDRKIRNLGADNLLMPAAGFLEKPEECTSHFSEKRWAEFKEDIKFFRTVSDREFFEKMQADHGYNPPPVWMIAGRFFADMFPAGEKILEHDWLFWLAQLDNVYLAGMFVALWWAFGWRVFAIAAVFWGCNAPGDDYFVQGAFLRQDWLFYLVFAACLARKRWFALSAASLVYAGLLRIFPGLVVIGWLVVAGAYLARHKRMAPHHLRMLLAGTFAAALLIGASVRTTGGANSYLHFYQHTLKVHDRTPLTNHMGLRVLIAQGIGMDKASGRAMYVKDERLADPFQVWKDMRNARYDKYKGFAYGIIVLSLAYFIWIGRRVKSMWVALCLAQIFIILLSQLTSYYYSFLVLAAPLTRIKKQIELPYLALAALTQFVWMPIGWFDDKSVLCTVFSLVFCFGLVCAFSPRGAYDRVLALIGRAPAEGPDPRA